MVTFILFSPRSIQPSMAAMTLHSRQRTAMTVLGLVATHGKPFSFGATPQRPRQRHYANLVLECSLEREREERPRVELHAPFAT